jgi:hypothetical protein
MSKVKSFAAAVAGVALIAAPAFALDSNIQVGTGISTAGTGRVSLENNMFSAGFGWMTMSTDSPSASLSAWNIVALLKSQLDDNAYFTYGISYTKPSGSVVNILGTVTTLDSAESQLSAQIGLELEVADNILVDVSAPIVTFDTNTSSSKTTTWFGTGQVSATFLW